MRIVLWIAASFESLRHVSDFEDFGYRPGHEIKANPWMLDRRKPTCLTQVLIDPFLLQKAPQVNEFIRQAIWVKWGRGCHPRPKNASRITNRATAEKA
jgi:hypothetical protein